MNPAPELVWLPLSSCNFPFLHMFPPWYHLPCCDTAKGPLARGKINGATWSCTLSIQWINLFSLYNTQNQVLCYSNRKQTNIPTWLIFCNSYSNTCIIPLLLRYGLLTINFKDGRIILRTRVVFSIFAFLYPHIMQMAIYLINWLDLVPHTYSFSS